MLLDLDVARTPDDVRRTWMLHGIAPRTGHDKLSYSTARDWWRAHPEGFTLVREGTEIVGAFALWPLRAERWEGLVDGRVTASQLANTDLHECPATATTWLLAGVSLRKYRRSHALLLLLRETAAMGILLAAHLGVVFALFLTMPYGKFMHGPYRYLALVQYSPERRTQGWRGS